MNLAFIVSILLFVGTAQGFLLAGALFTLRRGNVVANRILAVLLLTFSITIFFHTLAQFKPGFVDTVRDSWVGHCVFLLFGPLMYLYARALTTRSYSLSLKAAVHFVPFLSFVILYLVIRAQRASSIFAAILGVVMFIFIVVQMLSYLLAILKLLGNHTTRIRENFSYLERINLRWLRVVTIGQIVIWSVAFVVEMIRSDPREINVVWLLVSAFMYMVGYFGISQPEIFTARTDDGDPAAAEGKKYGKSSLSKEQAELILRKLEDLMATEKPYANPGLTLPILSKQLSVPTHYLSQVINQQLGKNFFEFVNRHRVEEAKRLLVDPEMQKLTLAAVGLEAGFNSVSSFNSIFKRLTSLTPSRYRALVEKGIEQTADTAS